MFSFTKQPISIFSVWKDAFRLFALSFSRVWYVMLLALVGFLLLAISFGIGLPFFHAYRSITLLISLIVFYIVVSVFMLYILITLYHRIYTAPQEHPTLGASLKFASANFMRILKAFLIIFCFALVPFILFLIPSFLPHGTQTVTNTYKLMAITLSTIGFIALIFFYIYMISISLFIPSILFEKIGTWEGLQFSRKLVKQNWWRTFITTLTPVLVSELILLLIGLCIGIIIAIISAVSGTGTTSPLIHIFLGVVHFTGMIAFFLIAYPYFISVHLVLFNDLKARKGLLN